MLAVHMQQPFRACPLMQIIDILRHNQHSTPIVPGPLRIQPRESMMRGVGLNFLYPRAAHIIKAQDKVWIAGKSLGRGDILDAVLLPQAARRTEGINATLGADARAG